MTKSHKIREGFLPGRFGLFLHCFDRSQEYFNALYNLNQSISFISLFLEDTTVTKSQHENGKVNRKLWTNHSHASFD